MQGRRSIARVLRRAVWVPVALLFVTLVVAVGVPLIVRGPVLARLLERAVSNRCGSVKLGGGHVSLGAVPALIFQRPFEVELTRADIREPDGNPMFRARVVRLRMAVLRHPWRVVVDDALVVDGGWRLIQKGLGVPLTAALRTIPPGGRLACGMPDLLEMPPPPAEPPRQEPLFTARAVTLERVGVELSFQSWAVKLDAIDARGTLEVRAAPQRLQILFDARDVRTVEGGTLRIGNEGERMTLAIPFDRVVVPRVAVTSSAPRDLRLQVAEARTAGAVLSGQAAFMNVFVSSPRLMPVKASIDARWRSVGQALALNGAWASVSEQLAQVDAELDVSLHGPFRGFIGTVALLGKGVSARARLLPRRGYALNIDFDHLDTTPLLPPARRTLLGGRLDGRVSASGQLSRPGQDSAISLDTIELALLRNHADPSDGLPRRLVASHAVGPRAADELRFGLGVVALDAEGLRVDPFRVEGKSMLLAGHLRGERERRPNTFRLRVWTQPGSRVTWGGETFLPPPLLDAHIDLARAMKVEPFSVQRAGGGTIDAGGSLAFDGPSDLWTAIRDYPMGHIPGLASVRAPGRRATVGELLQGQLNARFHVSGPVRRPALSGVLALSRVRWAGHALGNGRVVFSEERGGTRFDGPLLDGVDVRGNLHRHPGAEDFVTATVRDVALGPWLPGALAALGVRGWGEIVWRPTGGGSAASTTADLALRGPGIDLHASGRLDPAQRTAKVSGRLALARMRAALPALHLRQAAGVITMDVRLDDTPARATPQIDGAIAIVDRVSLWPVGWPAALVVPPTRVELRGSDVHVPSLAVLTSGARGTLAADLRLDWGQLKASQLAASIRVRIDGRGLGPWLPGRRGRGSGSASLDGQVTGSIGTPRIQGQARLQALTLDWPDSPFGAVRLDGPVTIDDRTVAVGPLTARPQGGGWLQVTGPDSRSSGRLIVTSRRGPLPVSDVDLTMRGSGLTTTHPIAGLTMRGLRVAVRLTEPNQNTLRLVGQVSLGHALYQVGKREPTAQRTRVPPILDHVWVRLRLVGPDDALVVGVPYVPDVTIGARCVIEGRLTSPRITGELRGDGLYSRAALAVADWFTSRDLRKCDLLPH